MNKTGLGKGGGKKGIAGKMGFYISEIFLTFIKKRITKNYFNFHMKQIKTRRDYHLAMAVIESYLAKGVDHLTPQEDDEFARLSKKVNEYEKVHFPMPVKHDLTALLEAYMKEHGLTRQKFAAFLGVGNSTLCEVLNKKRPITMDCAKKLHTKIHLDGNLILEVA
jgi:HTH-type transcriptional regulator / antitoxin HigA